MGSVCLISAVLEDVEKSGLFFIIGTSDLFFIFGAGLVIRGNAGFEPTASCRTLPEFVAIEPSPSPWMRTGNVGHSRKCCKDVFGEACAVIRFFGGGPPKFCVSHSVGCDLFFVFVSWCPLSQQ